jgi:hypothetical protein
MKVPIAYDGSDCSKAAMQDLRRAGLPADTEVLVLSVADLLLDVEALAADDVSASAQISSMVRQARALAHDAVANARETSAEGARLLTSSFPRWRIVASAACDYTRSNAATSPERVVVN